MKASDLVLIAAAGAGAFLLVRQLRAAPAAAAAAPAPARQASSQAAATAGLLGNVGGLLAGLLGSGRASSSSSGGWLPSIDVNGAGASGGYVGTLGLYVPDAAAVNPPGFNTEPYSYADQWTHEAVHL